MTLYQDENAVITNARQTAGKAARRKSRKIWVLAGLGTALAGGAAFAAVQLFGYGSIDQGAATLKDLTIADAKLTNTLVPGATVGGTGQVTNDNDFAVQVTGLIIKDAGLQGTGAACTASTLTPGGTPTTYPTGGTGHLITLASPVTIPANSVRTVTVPGVVSQASNATGLCGVKADFAVVAQVGNP